MKIVIDGRAATLYRGTGIGTYTYQLINNFNDIDFLNNHTLLIPSKSNLNLKLKTNFSIKPAANNNESNFWKFINNPNIIDYSNYDIYHVPQNGIGLYSNTTCSSVITLHDIIPLKMPKTVSDTLLKIFNDELPKILRITNGIITVSEFSKKDICSTLNYPPEKVFVTSLAAEDIYKPLDKLQCKSYLKSKYNITNDFILYVGGFSPRKNILGLIEAFSLVKKSYNKDIDLVILGHKGLSYDTYKSRTYDLNIESSVLFPGFIELCDMPIFYSASNMLVYPSFYEGFGLPPLEAMACGTPVISSSLTSLNEIYGDAAVLINPSNIDEISNSILKILNDSNFSSSLIYKGISHSSKFNWKNTAYETLDIYKKILSKV